MSAVTEPTMKARPQPPLHAWMTAIAVVLLLVGLVLELSLAHETLHARATLRHAVARAAPASSGSESFDDAALLTEARRRIDRHDLDEAATLLTARAEAVPTSESRTLAAYATTATGAFGSAARHATFARRLAPGDADAAARAEHAVDLALLGRLRTPARIAGSAAALFLLFVAVRASQRRREFRRLAAWLAGLDAQMSVTVDGRRERDGGPVPPDALALSIDLFLRPRGGSRRPPQPGPTLALVLSHAASNCTLRLTPRHDVREDAVRTRLKDETLARVLSRPGTWRVQARLEGRPVAEARVEVLPPSPHPAGRRLHLVGRV